MSQFKHTPGPWKNHGRIAQLGFPHHAVAAKTLIARVYSESFGDEENEAANARLVAASPELLEALIEADKTLCVLQSNVAAANKKDARWDGVWTELEHQRMAIQSVIAKATGGA